MATPAKQVLIFVAAAGEEYRLVIFVGWYINGRIPGEKV
jgi:hypothetical protein